MFGGLSPTWIGGFMITLDSNGGQCDLTYIFCSDNTTIGSLPVATRENCTFSGWITDDGKIIDQNYMPTKDIILHAYWYKESVINIGSVAMTNYMDFSKVQVNGLEGWYYYATKYTSPESIGYSKITSFSPLRASNASITSRGFAGNRAVVLVYTRSAGKTAGSITIKFKGYLSY